MDCYDDEEQDFEYEYDGIAQVRHHIREITQAPFGDEVVRDEVEENLLFHAGRLPSMLTS